MWWILAALLVGWLVCPLFLGQSATPSIPYSSFLTQVDKGNVSDVLIQGDQISGTLDQSASIKLTPDAQQPTEITHFKT
ncbi:MAG: ATP-dependent metallopeptidase FtsH/Yme1/Tma family protein, partial [Acidimicrobiia bacterium]